MRFPAFFFRGFAPRIVLAAAALVALNLVWLYPALQNVRNAASVLALETAERIRTSVTFSLETALKDLVRQAEDIASDPMRSEFFLNRLLKINPGFRELTIIGADGIEELRVDRLRLVDRNETHDYSAVPYFIQARGGQENFGDIAVTPDGEPYTTIAVPIRSVTGVRGVLVATYNLRSLVVALQDPGISRGTAYIVDRNGFLIAHPNITQLLRRPNLLSRSIVRKVVGERRIADGLASEDGYENIRGTAIFAVGKPIPVAGMGLFFEQPRGNAFAAERQLYLFASVVIALGLLIVLAMLSGSARLARLNAALEERNRESVVSAKILVRRDRELVAANNALRELLVDLENAGKMLVRRDLELTRANARLEELDQLKSEFVSIAAHQLRTPLTGVRWSYQTMLDEESGALTPEQRRLLESGFGATLRMVDLVNDLLNVARIEEGRFGIHLKKQPIAPLLERFAVQYANLAKEKAIAFALELPPDPLPDLIFDEDKFGIVLDNLLDNALKYTEPGGGIALRVAREGDAIHIDVADTGIGIPSAQTHRVFTKFFRADNALRLHTAGTGLGLYVTKNIVERHGGAIHMQSQPGKGSVFRVTLPIP